MHLRLLFMVLFVSGLAWPTLSQARPVSYPGGWTAMTMNDKDKNSLHVHYTLDPKNSIGWRHEYLRGPSVNTDFMQHNMLLKRWNGPASQANLYLKSGVGVAYKDGDVDPAGFTGLAIDWEDRRYFTSYSNRFFRAGNFESYAKHNARIGVAPYVGDYGDLHTWLMLETEYNPSADDDFSLTPLVRLFKGTTLVEAGYNLDDGVLFNVIQRF